MNANSKSVWALPALILLAACTAPAPDKSEIGNTERKGFVAGIMLAEGTNAETPPKVIVTSYAVKAAAVTQMEAVVTYGSGGLSTSSGEDYRLELVAANDRILQSYSVADPRKFVVEKQGVVENPEGVLTVRFRFDPDATLIRVRDKDSAVVAETDLRPLIAEFCRRSPGDTDCRTSRK